LTLTQSVNTRSFSEIGIREMENKYCWSCESDLTPENTSEFGGLDSGNLHASRSVGLNIPVEMFTKCDDCFNADIDRHLESQYS
jgi:hypothetical protein